MRQILIFSVEIKFFTSIKTHAVTMQYHYFKTKLLIKSDKRKNEGKLWYDYDFWENAVI